MRTFPKELRRALKALGDDVNAKIVSILADEEMHFSDLMAKLGTSQVPLMKEELISHLKELISAGLIDNFSRGGITDYETSYYRLTEYGRDLIFGIYEAFHRAIGLREA